MEFCQIFDASTGSTGIVSHGLTALCLVLDQKGGAFLSEQSDVDDFHEQLQDSHHALLRARYVEHSRLGYGCEL